ncbi:MAG TPA: PadR family transcriptional regulator [Anaerolineaceae bacterium]|jgi:PadR family transcriptional regulator PadR|nr:PadR family transcriptional regulator [Anaerolineaceae bacterium]
MLSSDVLRGYTDMIIISLLLDEPNYGYEISRRIRTTTEGKFVMKETTLYSAFNRMEKNGLLTSFYGTESGGKRRTYYSLTDTGRAFYREKIDEWVLTKEIVEKFIRK